MNYVSLLQYHKKERSSVKISESTEAHFKERLSVKLKISESTEAHFKIPCSYKGKSVYILWDKLKEL